MLIPILRKQTEDVNEDFITGSCGMSNNLLEKTLQQIKS